MQTESIPNVEFKAGEMAVHPAHGVGEVTGVETREAGGQRLAFYVLRILDSGNKVMVSVGAAAQVGLRRVMSREEADQIVTILKAQEVAVDVQPWAKRQRVYTEMLKSGSPSEAAKVLRDMARLKLDKDLSFGERRLLDQAKGLLANELALAHHVEKKTIEASMTEWTARAD